MAVYGHHHPARTQFGMYGGACPAKGGDFGTYPWGKVGGAWPHQYEEIGPLCDGFVLDVKIWANLDVVSWLDNDFGVGNAGYEGDVTNVEYTVEPNQYGEFVDPYLTDILNITNPNFIDLSNGVLIETAENKLPEVSFVYNFTRPSHYLNYITPSKQDMQSPNEGIFQKDKTLRPRSNPGLCASHVGLDIKTKMYWRNCGEVGHETAFEFTSADNEIGTIKTEKNGETKGEQVELCWQVDAPNRRKKQKVVLKKCKPGDVRQLWVVSDGQIWLKHTYRNGQGLCVPFMGENTKLVAKWCYSTLARYSVNGRFDGLGN